MTDGEKQNLCMGCMSMLDEDGKCPQCGYFENKKASSREYLPVRAEISERYLVGKMLAQNGERALYLGYDLEEDRKIYISEYFPYTIAKRNESDSSITARYGKEAQYKSLLYDFIENAEILRDICVKHTGIVPVLDVLSQNGTSYAIYRYIQAQTLSEYLLVSGGELTWAQAKPMIMPLLKTLSAFNQKGVIHRGISPDALLVDDKGKLWFFGFGGSAVRTGGSELTCELFSGYSAPEQYAANGWQGAWTDVYGVAAVLYRMLTGTLPVSAELRRERDSLYPPNMLNKKIPQNVSDAIDGAMAVSVEKRTQSTDKFVVELLETSESNTAIFSSGSAGRRGRQSDSLFGAIPYWLRVMLVTIVLLIIVVMIAYFGFIVPQISREAEASSLAAASSMAEVQRIEDERIASELEQAKGDPMPDFSGQFATRIQSNPAYKDKYVFTVEEEYNEDGVAPGVVYDQLPSAGTHVAEEGASVVLYVSKGSQIAAMPYLIGSTVELAGRTLADLKIFTDIKYEDSTAVEPGLVIRTSVEPYADVTKEKDIVYLYVSRKPVVSVPDEIWITPPEN